jgi:hypothetical protein
LIFKEPTTVLNVFKDKKKAVDEYSKLLLPGINIEKPSIIKHNENYIIKTFNGYLFGKEKSVEKLFIKNETIKTKHFNIKFDLSWKKDTNYFIKPISFDFNDEISIQRNSAVYYSYLTDLQDYAKSNNARFDFLISKPQILGLNRAFENAIDFLDDAKTNKKLIFENEFENYSQNILFELSDIK